jgi:glycoside/pentoside/hexuronide:cation symporter, GPH family
MAEAEGIVHPQVVPRASVPKLPLGTVLAYGVPIMGFAYLLFFVQFYLLKFATDVLLVGPAVVGVLFGVGRIWDAVSDPLAGYLSDRTRTRLGRRRPWLLAALLPIIATFVMIWSPPAHLEGGALVLWLAVAIFGFYTALTMYQVPHMSLGAELSRDYHERSRVFGVQSAAWTIGLMLSFVGIQIVSTAEKPRDAATLMALASGLVAISVLLIAPVLLRERPEHQGRGSSSPYGAFRDVLRNPHARVLLVVWLIQGLGAAVLGTLAPFLAQYILREPDQMAKLPAFFVVASVGSVPWWVWLSRRLGKRDVWRTAMVGTALSFGGTFFVGAGELTLMRVLLVGAGFFSGCGQVLGPSMLADVIDYDEHRTGERKEGAYAAAWGFVIKGAIGLQIMVTGLVLQLAGFEPNVEQTDTVKLALRILYAGLPFVSFLVGARLIGRFAFNEREHAEVRALLDARSSTAEA